ncbi:hypothetical protein MNBD_GAMMA09-1859 [hydrothermal vent metagenome]|uniref:Ice-binding protein C-terminal domain-containing protein n=1 Tax=hydrothermal vent metagenome TaxID=652676 RepID=A0A3B0YIP6_9ZZZZ
MKKMILTGSIVVALTGGMNMPASAALSSSATLNFMPGVVVSPSSHGDDVISGSYFGIDTSADGRVSLAERVAISQNDGLILGSVQGASGNHLGSPGCDPATDVNCTNTGEFPGIDNPWRFFGNTGMSLTTSPVNILSDDGVGNVTLDFSGWGIIWGSNTGVISLGGGVQECGTASDGICIDPINGSDISGSFNNGSGIALVTCAVDCAAGDTYTLDYSAFIAQADPSFFGGLLYEFRLEGTVSSVPLPAAVWLFGSGLLGLAGVVRRRKVQTVVSL